MHELDLKESFLVLYKLFHDSDVGYDTFLSSVHQKNDPAVRGEEKAISEAGIIVNSETYNFYDELFNMYNSGKRKDLSANKILCVVAAKITGTKTKTIKAMEELYKELSTDISIC